MNDQTRLNDDFLVAYRQAPPPHTVEALWERLNQQEENQRMYGQRMMRRLSWSAAALLTASLLIMNTAELRTLAQDVINLFSQAESDEWEYELTPEPRYFFAEVLIDSQATFENARSLVDFVIPEPTVPEPYALSYFVIKGPFVVIGYHHSADGSPYYTPEPNSLAIQIRDCAALEATDDACVERRIGASAEITRIDLGNGVQAQYVAGHWIDPETGNIGSIVGSGTAVQVWNNDYPFHHLQWEHAGLMYSIITTNPRLNQADLAAIAISMMDQVAP
ncbi:MAG: hypothetical protein JW966_01840 [Anaerolineae bacterium]|nr:hypothetical protein [Anaerolineae bacterium]